MTVMPLRLTHAAAALAIAALLVFAAAAPRAQAGFQTCGDPTNDGVVDSLDALYVLQVDAVLLDLPAPAFATTDVNADGFVDAVDALFILQHSAALLDELTC